MIPIKVNCRICKSINHVHAEYKDILAWQAGELIQNVLGYLSDDERELLISETCPECFNKLFPEDDE